MNRSSDPLLRRVRETVRRDPPGFAAAAGTELRPYQSAATLAIKDSITRNLGRTFVLVFPRQSGKDETLAQLVAWTLLRYMHRGGSIVYANPTFKPQTINAMDRVRTTLDRNPITRGRWSASAGFAIKLGSARLQFFSAEPGAHVVGATASLLLIANEAQDIMPAKFDKDFDPMTASTNATRVFAGTTWTTDTLLARQIAIARQEQAADGIQRLFFHTADDIAMLVPAYAQHLARVIAERGRQHPLVKTQYFCETIDEQAGMFNAARLALMQADQPEQSAPTAGTAYAFTLDIAGADEAALVPDGMRNPGRDSTALSVIAIDPSTVPALQGPTYRVVHRRAWTGIDHLTLYGQLQALADHWRPQHIIADATGVGEGITSMLARAFPERVTPVKFTQQEKSEIGWRFLNIIETGRFRDCAPSDITRTQYAKCRSEILPGPTHTLRWGVPDGTRDAAGLLVHDDHITADSLIAKLEELEWRVTSPTLLVPPPLTMDPLPTDLSRMLSRSISDSSDPQT